LAESNDIGIARLEQVSNVTIRYVPSEVLMYTLSGEQLDSVSSMGINNSVNTTFFGVAVGAFVAFVIVVMTVTISDPRIYAAFVALTAVSGFLSAFLGIKIGLDCKKAKEKLRTIKREPN
jgi:bacteriorhodopsin